MITVTASAAVFSLSAREAVLKNDLPYRKSKPPYSRGSKMFNTSTVVFTEQVLKYVSGIILIKKVIKNNATVKKFNTFFAI